MKDTVGVLGADNGEVLGTADGLGCASITLSPGDVLAQRHHFSRPLEGTDVWLRTGAYWLDTMELWPVMGVRHNALFVPLEAE